MRLTDEQRSMIASAFVASRSDPFASLCCNVDDVTPTATEACRVIVGKTHALVLQDWMYNECGCTAFEDEAYEADTVQRYLDKIASLDELGRQ